MPRNQQDSSPASTSRQQRPVPLFTWRDSGYLVKALWPLAALYAGGVFALGVFVLGYDVWTVMTALLVKAVSVIVMVTVVFLTAIRWPSGRS
jgi:hypothetical protein